MIFNSFGSVFEQLNFVFVVNVVVAIFIAIVLGAITLTILNVICEGIMALFSAIGSIMLWIFRKGKK